MEAFLVSTGIVALAEIGDKTQLLAFVLAARFRKPLPIACGILIATLLNHGAAAALGAWIPSLLSPETLRWILGVSFLVMAGWVMIPDKFDETATKPARCGRERQQEHWRSSSPAWCRERPKSVVDIGQPVRLWQSAFCHQFR